MAINWQFPLWYHGQPRISIGFLDPVATFWQTTCHKWQSCAVAPATTSMTTAIPVVLVVGFQVLWATAHPWDIFIVLDLFS